MSVFGLYQTIAYRQRVGLDTKQYIFAFWQRLIQPLTTIVMICLGVPFVFGSLRSSSMGMRVMVGVMIGFGFYLINQLFGPLTLVYRISPIVSAIIPTLFFSAFCVLMMRRIKI